MRQLCAQRRHTCSGSSVCSCVSVKGRALMLRKISERVSLGMFWSRSWACIGKTKSSLTVERTRTAGCRCQTWKPFMVIRSFARTLGLCKLSHNNIARVNALNKFCSAKAKVQQRNIPSVQHQDRVRRNQCTISVSSRRLRVVFIVQRCKFFHHVIDRPCFATESEAAHESAQSIVDAVSTQVQIFKVGMHHL